MDLVDHVKTNDFIFDRDERKRPPFQFKCRCCSGTLQCLFQCSSSSTSLLLRLLCFRLLTWLLPRTVHNKQEFYVSCQPASVTWYQNLDHEQTHLYQYTRFHLNCGPCGSGKTQIVSNMLMNQTKIFNPSFEKNFSFYSHYEINFDTVLTSCIAGKLSIKFHKGLIGIGQQKENR